MEVVLLGALAGMAFGAYTVAIRVAMGQRRDAAAGGAVASIGAFLIVLVVAIGAGDGGMLTDDPAALLPFFLIGVGVPGLSQLAFANAVTAAGPSRAAVVVGTAPLLSSGLAVIALGEPWRPALAVGTVLVVLGGASLAWERERPAGFAAYGIALAALCAVLFAIRDNVVRDQASDTDVPALLGTMASLFGAALALTVATIVTRPSRGLERLRAATRPFLICAVILGFAYACLFIALDHGKVTIVAPLNATQSLWAVAFSAIVMPKHEKIGPRLLIAAALIVAGSALVAATR